jgi:hypothetical protein
LEEYLALTLFILLLSSSTSRGDQIQILPYNHAFRMSVRPYVCACVGNFFPLVFPPWSHRPQGGRRPPAERGGRRPPALRRS